MENMLETLMIGAWSGLAVCAVILTTRRTVPITADDAKVIWKMHHETAHCRGHTWRLLKRKQDKIVGFQCECGYKYTQKRPLACRSLKQNVEQPEFNIPFSF